MSAMCATQSSLLLRVPKPLSLPKQRRLLRSSEFREVYHSGTRMSCRYFAAFCLRQSAQPEQPARIGFTLPRAVGKAVVRNRIRRRMREVTRALLGRVPDNWLVVFNPRRTVLEAPFDDLCREAGRIFDRCKERS